MGIRLLMLISAIGLVACVTGIPVETTPAMIVPSAAIETGRWACMSGRNVGGSLTPAAGTNWCSREVATVSSDAADSSVKAVWSPRKVHFGGCNVELWEFVLLAVGARAGDLNLHTAGCSSHGMEATFSVLVPADKTEKDAAGGLVAAHWQTVELRTPLWEQTWAWAPPGVGILEHVDACVLLDAVTQDILPSFSAGDVTRIPRPLCDRLRVGLRAQVLMPLQSARAAAIPREFPSPP